MKVKRCGECGAELRLGPDSCPLCGADVASAEASRRAPEREIDGYQSNVRRLRDELKRLRDEDLRAS